ncbi:hypothetical protein [Phenylobacterium sp.]|uniref:hypothetical protein n=1 Tax=Phenylobacterium sp. TaxID=1871053 RepID=UPI0035AE0699
MSGLRAALAGAALALLASSALAQDLVVVGRDGASKTFTAEDLAKLPRSSVEVAWGGAKHVFEGPKIAYVLRAAGAPVGARMHGDPMTTYVTVTGADGFVGLYSLPELDDFFHDGPAVLADTEDGAKLSGKYAPYRLVMGGDRKPWRSAYGVVRIELHPVAAPPMADAH